MKDTSHPPPKKVAQPRSILIGLTLSAIATALALYGADTIYDYWYYGDADRFAEESASHIASYEALRPGGTYRIASFPARLSTDEVPTYQVTMNAYFFREREFPLTPEAGVVRVFAVGDSATFGTGVAQDERFTDVLDRLLNTESPGCCEVLNAGRVGATSDRIREMIQEELLNRGADVLIVNAGANDIRSQDHPMALDETRGTLNHFEETMRTIVSVCRAEGVPVVLWANGNADPRRPSLKPARNRLRTIATELKLPLVELLTVAGEHPATPVEQQWFLDNKPWTSFHAISLGESGIPLPRAALFVDWMHPNKFGHRRLAEALLPPVRAAIKQARSPAKDPPAP